MRARSVPFVTVCVFVALLAPGAPPAGADQEDPAQVGRFGKPFQEPGEVCVKDADGRSTCKPAAASIAMLPSGEIVYWDSLEGMEDVEASVVAEYGDKAGNNPSRVLDLRGRAPSWRTPTPEDGGANPQGNDEDAEYLPGVPHDNDYKGNDGDMFCADQVFLSDGRVLVAGGTSYYLEPGSGGLGATELEGLRNSRTFDPATSRWEQSGSMTYGRWYPSLVTLGDGRVFVASGVTKLIKPVYPDRPQDSGTNVKQTEIYDPRTGRWTANPASASRTLPLYPRLRLLPNGKVYYDAAGQTYNPNGQSYDEALWNLAAVYDPQKQTWRDLGVPFSNGGGVGFRGSTFSQMLPLKPPYDRAQFLAAGGVAGTTPGAYVGSVASALNTVEMHGDSETFTSTPTGPLAAPRWYPTGVTLPTGQVLAFNGADVDEVINPGSGRPVKYVEMYDPDSRTWRTLETQSQGRTYHNTAALLPDGRVLVGGHSPIATGYGKQDPSGEARGLSSPYRDPSFEIYSPPNLFYGPRPVITGVDPAVGRGRALDIAVTDAADIAGVVLVRNTALTHVVDGDQRNVELAFTRTATGVRAAVPASPNVLPPGPYLLFVNKKTDAGLTPSVSRQVFVGAPVPASLAATMAENAARQTSAELAARSAASPPEAAAPVAAPDRPAAALPATGGGPGAAAAVAVAVGLLLARRRRRQSA
jgi:hypothetical protein